jgi:hypothetical protein
MRSLTGRARVVALVSAALLASLIPGLPAAAQEETASAAAFQDAMRKLWEDHITWTRLYIVGVTSGPEDLPDVQATTDRLLANQIDIGDAIKPYYGDDAGTQLSDLLTDHILIATEVIAGAEEGDDAALEDATSRWQANGDEIATFLSSANPDSWPVDQLKGHMRTHLDLTTEEAVAHLEGRYEDSVTAYDKVHAQILEMADMLSAGIISQFPDAFAE